MGAARSTPEDLFVSPVGGLIDDWWNLRPGGVDNTVSLSILGSVSPTALGLALALPHRRVVAIETDGSVLMNLGAVCNGLYECIGSAPTLTAAGATLAAIAAGAGCAHVVAVRDEDDLGVELDKSLAGDDLGYLVARIGRACTCGPRSSVDSPTASRTSRGSSAMWSGCRATAAGRGAARVTARRFRWTGPPARSASAATDGWDRPRAGGSSTSTR